MKSTGKVPLKPKTHKENIKQKKYKKTNKTIFSI